jgi:flavin reductase (DIM6/NTAB) family NADH-FMN oxidoreductase RutF
VSEYALAGLHPAPSTFIRAPHVAESALSIECKLHTTIPIYSKSAKSAERDRQPVRTATLVLVEAVMFHVREDVVDEKKETVDIRVLRPV